MKTYEGFLLEGVGDRLGKMSDEEFAQFQKGRSKEEAEEFASVRNKARGKGDKSKANRSSGKKVNSSGGSIVVRKPTTSSGGSRRGSSSSPAGGAAPTKSPTSAGVTGGLGPKSRSSNAPPVDPKKKRETIHRYVPRTVIPDKGKEEKEKEKEQKQRREREKGKGLNLGIRDKLATAATELAKTETNKDVQTYEAKPVA